MIEKGKKEGARLMCGGTALGKEKDAGKGKGKGKASAGIPQLDYFLTIALSNVEIC